MKDILWISISCLVYCKRKSLWLQCFELAKSRAKCAYYQRTCVPAWFMCQHGCVLVRFTCKRVCVPTCPKRANASFLCANKHASVPFGVPAKRHANFSKAPFMKCYWKCLYFIIIKKFYIILNVMVNTYIYMIYCTY